MSAVSEKSPVFLYVVAILVQAMWALTPSASNIVIAAIPVELYVALRWTVSGMILLAIAFARGMKLDLRPSMLGRYFMIGLIGYGLSSLFTLHSLRIGGVVNFALLSSVNPLILSAMSIFMLQEKVRRTFWIASPLCVAGLVVMVMGKNDISGIDIALMSAVLVICAYICDGVPFVFSKRYGGLQSLPAYMAMLQLSAAIFMWSGQVAYFQQFSSLSAIDLKVAGSIAFVSVVSCIICYGLFYWLLRKMDGHRLAIFDGLHAVFAAFYGWIFFSEQFNSMMLIGGALLILSIYIANSEWLQRLVQPAPPGDS